MVKSFRTVQRRGKGKMNEGRGHQPVVSTALICRNSQEQRVGVRDLDEEAAFTRKAAHPESLAEEESEGILGVAVPVTIAVARIILV